MRDFQSAAIVTSSVLVALMGMLGLLMPSWIDSEQSLAMDLAILFGACLIASVVSLWLTKPGGAR
jgi:hypothetical protein